MQRFSFALRIIFWLAVAYLPLAIDREITAFMVDQRCMPGSECLKLAMPLIVQLGLVGWAARVLLWPLAFWHLGGSWLWKNFRQRRSVIATS
ncbi:MAG TPA: hypothetical protein VFS95_07565 [Telluria sp.]|nr:hypothetical protein [Telluria sp.]